MMVTSWSADIIFLILPRLLSGPSQVTSGIAGEEQLVFQYAIYFESVILFEKLIERGLGIVTRPPGSGTMSLLRHVLYDGVSTNQVMSRTDQWRIYLKFFK